MRAAGGRRWPRMPETDDRQRTFEHDAPAVLSQVRGALLQVISALAARPTNANELARAVGVNPKLAWQIWSITQSEGPLPSSRHLPGAGGMRIFLKAAQRKVPSALIERAAGAAERLSGLRRRHARDRASLDILLDGLTPE